MPYGYSSQAWSALPQDQRTAAMKKATPGVGAAPAANRQLAAQGQPGQFTTQGGYQVLGGKGSVSAGPSSALPSFPGFAGGGMSSIGQTAAQMYAGGGEGGGGGGTPGAGGVAATPELTLRAEGSPDLQRATAQFESQFGRLQQQGQKVDQNLQFQIDEYKKRLGEGPTTRAIERSASAIRDQMAGMASDAERAGAAAGRGSGFQAGAIGEAGQRALAGSSADIALGRESQLDQLVLGGQGIMAAPGQRELAYDTLSSGFFGQAPYEASAQFGLAEKGLGLQAYGQQGDLALRQAALQQQQYGTPMDWFRTLYGG